MIRIRVQAAKNEEEKQRIRAAAADRTIEARSKIIRMVMHDLRSPALSIHSISSNLEEMSSDQSSVVGLHEVLEQLRCLNTCSSTIERVLSDMLTFERIDSGRLCLVYEDFCIADLLRTAQQIFAAIARAKGVQLVLEPVEPHLACLRVRGDQKRLEQCMCLSLIHI